MLRFLVIVALVTYIVYKIASFFFRFGAASRQMRDQQRNHQGNMHNGRDRRRGSGFKGGEYVDYEEVKNK